MARIADSLAVTNHRIADVLERGWTPVPKQHHSYHLLGAVSKGGVPEDFVGRLAAQNIYLSFHGGLRRIAPHLHVNEQDLERLSTKNYSKILLCLYWKSEQVPIFRYCRRIRWNFVHLALRTSESALYVCQEYREATAVARILGLHHKTVSCWLVQAAEHLLVNQPKTKTCSFIEVDKLCSFVSGIRSSKTAREFPK